MSHNAAARAGFVFLLLRLLTASALSDAAEAAPSSLSVVGEYSSDSDTITAYKETFQSQYSFSPALSFNARLENLNMSADSSSGLATVRGNEDVAMQSVWVGPQYRFDDAVTARLLAGLQDSSAGTGTVPLTVKLEDKITDALQTTLAVSHEMYALSPRAVSLDIARTDISVHEIWQGTSHFKITGDASYAEFSDNNSKTGISISPSYRFLQDDFSSLDAGFRFQWYGFAHRLNDGYYSPERYQSYYIPLSYYREFGQGHHILVSAAPGMYKDQSSDGFRPAGDALVEAVFKVGESWDFNMHAGFIRSGGITSSEYDQRLVGIGLAHRF